MDPGCSHTLFAEHMGRHVVPATVVGSRTSRYSVQYYHHRIIGGRLRHYDA